jgi:TusA-related sulfurtransferase
MTSTTPAAVVTLDMTGVSCPLPLLGAKRVLDDLPDGRPMVLISDCPGTADDLRAWAAVTAHEVLRTQRLDGRRVAYTLCRKSDEARGPANEAANVVLDLRGAVCPGPILEAKRLLDGMQPGEVLVLLSNCPGARSDVQAWTDNTSIELLDVYAARNGDVEFYLRRRAKQRVAATA